MNTAAAMAIGEIAAVVAAVVLFFFGLRTAVRSLDAGDAKRTAESDIPKSALKKSLILLGAAVACYMLSRFFQNQGEMSAAGYGTGTILLQSLWEAVRNTGFILLIPLVLIRKRPKKETSEDDD
jgi:Na+/H+ antiporter NhaD/arsenite permease-like protein